jgi:putative Holliday junction resolvase
MARILAIDYGDRWIGLAMSDPMQLVAFPLRVVDGEPALQGEIERLFAQEEIERLVLGMPLNMDGSTGPKGRQVLEFKERLEKRFSLPVETWDERLTTVQAEAALRQAGLRGTAKARGRGRGRGPQKMGGRKKARDRRVDQIAAQILLQSYLDRQKGPPDR